MIHFPRIVSIEKSGSLIVIVTQGVTFSTCQPRLRVQVKTITKYNLINIIFLTYLLHTKKKTYERKIIGPTGIIHLVDDFYNTLTVNVFQTPLLLL
jgi:hypothetical protein